MIVYNKMIISDFYIRLFFMANNDLNQINIFTQVANLQSFTRAAESLNIEKSTVSAKIAQLESRLGIRLLHRTTRSVNLTDAGAEYLKFCESALESLKLGDDFIAELSNIPAGNIRVSTPHDLVEFWMPTVITPFLKQYPKINLEIIQTNKNVDLIKGKFDIAIRSSNEEIQDSSLIYRKIYQAELMAVASKSYIESYGLVKKPFELNNIPSVGVTNSDNQETKIDTIYWQDQKVTLKHRLAVNSMSSVKHAIKSGLGFGILSKNMIKKELQTGELVELNCDIKIKPTSLYIVYPSRAGQPAKLKAFVEALVKWGEKVMS